MAGQVEKEEREFKRATRRQRRNEERLRRMAEKENRIRDLWKMPGTSTAQGETAEAWRKRKNKRKPKDWGLIGEEEEED